MENLPRLHVILRAGELEDPARVEGVLDAGGAALAVHLRTPELGGAKQFEAASWLVEQCRSRGAVAIVNDRVDVALAAGAGVHLKAESVGAETVRGLVGEDALVGRSIHRPSDARDLRDAPLDYLVLGSVFPTQSHPHRSPLDDGAVALAVSWSAVPLVAIGGVTPSRVPWLLAQGVYGCAVLRGVWEARHPREAVLAYLEVLSTA